MSDATEKKPLDPHNTVCVVKDKTGAVLARIRATAPDASRRMEELSRQHGGVSVEYVEDAAAASVAGLLGGLFGGRR